MSKISNYLKTKIINSTLRNIAYTSATTLYLALYTTAPDANGQGGVEAAYAGYARVDISDLMSAPSAGQTRNTSTILFPQNPASGATVNIVAVGITVELSDYIIFYHSFTSVPILVSQSPRILENQFTLTES